MAKILIIDDEQSIRDNLKSLLVLDDYEALAASNGSEGLKVFHDNHPEIIILDMKMPGMNGIEVLKKIKIESKETLEYFGIKSNISTQSYIFLPLSEKS